MTEYRQTVGTGRLNPAPPSSLGITENYEPRREPTRHSDVVVPLWQALISASLLTALLTILGVVLVSHIWWLLVPVLFLSLLTWFWFWSLGWVKQTLYRIETLIDRDLTGDHQVGEPDPRPVPFHSATTPRPTDAEAAQKQRRLEEFVAMCFQHDTDTRTLKGLGFKDNEIKMFGNYLRQIGAAAWKNQRNHLGGWHFVLPLEQVRTMVAHTVWADNRLTDEQ